VLALFLLVAPGDTLTTFPGIEGKTSVPIPRIEDQITVDGQLAEPVWQRAARLTGFSQYAPVDGRPADQATEVLVWYSATALHLGVRAQAKPGTVRATLANRDRLATEDRIEFYLGTYHDGHQALVFGVNPLGVQQDGTLAEQGAGSPGVVGIASGREAVDLSPDFVYASGGRLTEFGYEVEVRIPFKTLRYQSRDVQSWGLHVLRWVQAAGQEDSWVPARRAAPSFLNQSGALTGLSDLRRGIVMDLNPVVTARADGAPSIGGWGYDGAAEFGGNLRWGVTPNLTLNGTYNPDFSQVEADASQILTDPRRALFFPEKRPFFLEGIEQFNTPNQLIYSRRIAAPVAAAKLSGKVGTATVATMLALDGKEVSRTGRDHPFFAIGRVLTSLGGGSRAGLVFTSRSEPGLASQLGGADVRLVTRGGVVIAGQLAGSATTEAGRTTVAPLWDLDVRRQGRRVGFNAGFSGVSDRFVAAAGFIGAPDAVYLSGGTQFTFYGKPGGLVARVNFGPATTFRWIYQDFTDGREVLDRQLFVSGNVELRGGWSLRFFNWLERFGYDRRLFRNHAIERRLPGGVVDTMPYPTQPAIRTIGPNINLTTPWVGPFALELSTFLGNDVNYDEWSPARITFVNSTLQFRPTDQFRADFTYILTRYQRRTDGTVVSAGHIPRLKVEYQVSRAVFLRAVGEYRSLERDSLRDDGRSEDPILIRDPQDGIYKRSLALAQRSNSLRADFLFSYQPSPGTVFFAGYGGGFQDQGRFRFTGLDRTADGFFLKASYLFRM
jgi:hypothetical protein